MFGWSYHWSLEKLRVSTVITSLFINIQPRWMAFISSEPFFKRVLSKNNLEESNRPHGPLPLNSLGSEH